MSLERVVKLEVRRDSSYDVVALTDPQPKIVRPYDPLNKNILIAAAKVCAQCPLETDCKPTYKNVRRGLLRSLSLEVKGTQIGSPDCALATEQLRINNLGAKAQATFIRKLRLTRV